MSRSHRAFLIAVFFTPLTGCCALAELWCGPDRSEWISERYETPEDTIKTFREAVRRRALRVIKSCLSEACKRDTGLIGAIEVGLAWDRLEAQSPGLHLLGGAEISAPQINADQTVTYRLSRSGYEFEVVLVRQDYWEVWYYKAKDFPTPHDASLYLDAGGLGGLVQIETERDEDGLATAFSVHVRTPKTDEIYLEEFAVRDLHRVVIGRNWKVLSFAPVDAQESAQQ